MKKRLLCLIFILMLFPGLVFAKEVTLKEFNYNDSQGENYMGVTETLDGGYIAVGVNFEGSYIVKYDKTDKIVWEKKLNSNVYIADVDIDAEDNFYIVGYTYGDATVQYDEAVGYIAKYDKTGKEVEVTLIGDGEDERYILTDLEINDKNVVVVGYADFKMPKANRNVDEVDGDERTAYSAILDKDLKLITDNLLDYDYRDLFAGVSFTSDGGYIAVGSSFSSNIPGVTLLSHYTYVPIIAKYDKDYKLEWMKVLPLDSRLNENNSCYYTLYDFYGFMDVIESCDGNYVAVGAIPRLTSIPTPEESSSRDKLSEMLGNNYNGLEIDYESDEYMYFESASAVMVKYDKSGKILKEHYENTEYDDNYTDVLELPNCDLLVTGNIGHRAFIEPSNLGKSNEVLGWNSNTCVSGDLDPKLLLFKEDFKEDWSKLYEAVGYDILLNVSPVGPNEFAAVGGFDSYQVGEAKLDEEYKDKENYIDALVVRLKITYEINIEETENGKFDAVNQHGVSDIVYHGDIATITTTPDEGYKVNSVKVVDSKGNEVPVEKVENGIYEYHITDDTWVTVTFAKKEIVEAPKTGVQDFLLLAVILLVIAGVVYNSVNKNQVFKKM